MHGKSIGAPALAAAAVAFVALALAGPLPARNNEAAVWTPAPLPEAAHADYDPREAVIYLAAGANAPDQAVRDFYKAVAENKCGEAARIRPGYSENRCREITAATVKKADLRHNDDGVAVVFLDVTYSKASGEASWSGFVKLDLRGGEWIIDNGSYRSNYKFDDYKAEFVPAKGADFYYNFRSDEVRGMPERDPVATFGDMSFGSARVLSGCFTDGELEGWDGDEKVLKNDPVPYKGQPPRGKQKTPITPVPPDKRNSIRYVEPYNGRKLVAITFDLCERTKERTGYDRDIVNYLRRNGIKATFFAGGKWMRSHPEKTKQLMADPLFEIGNHAWTHGNLRVLTGEEMRDQVDWTQVQYEILRDELVASDCASGLGREELEKIPPVPYTFRFPYGTCSREALDYLAAMGLPAIQWSVVTGDPERNKTGDGIARIVLGQAEPGSIVIMHANGRGHGTAEALPLFVPELLKRGYEFVTVSELLEQGVVYSSEECYETKPGDNLKYDKKFGKGT